MCYPEAMVEQKNIANPLETNTNDVIKNIRNLHRLLHISTKHRFLVHQYIVYCQLVMSTYR